MLTVIVLTHNESANISRCLKSLRFCQEMLVIDDNSTDDTVKLAASLGAKVISHPLNSDFSAQRNFALTQVTTPWALFVDADEEVTPELAQEIVGMLPHAKAQAFTLSRLDYLWDTQLHHGDAGQTELVRVGQTQAGKWVGRVHEVWQTHGRTAKLTHPLLHYPHPTVVDFLRHINFYSTLRARELIDQNKRTSLFGVIFWPPVKFMYLYIFRLGFLDGMPGLVSAWIMSFYTFLTKAKTYLQSSTQILPSD